MSSKQWKIVGVVAVVVLITGITSFAVLSQSSKQAYAEMIETVDSDLIYHNIAIQNVDVGGLSVEAAAEKVAAEFVAPMLSDNAILLKNGDQSWRIPFSELGYTFDVESAVQAAYHIAREGEVEQRFAQIESLANNPVTIELDVIFNRDTLNEKLDEIAQEVNHEPVNATIVRSNRQFIVTEGAPGTVIDKEKTLALLIEAAETFDDSEVELLLMEQRPEYMASDFDNVQSLLGTFSTPVTGSASRDVNLTVASEKVNGTILMPGEVFSTNDTIGPTTYENGYRMAPVIVNGKLEDGIGGGVCQVSSTLYNAVLFSELEIVERQNHSLTVAYVEIGRDATLAGDVIDFKFKNSTDAPVFIEGYLEGTRLHFNIYGHETRPSNRTITFDSAVVGSTGAPAEKVIEDPSLPEGTRNVVVTALSGRTAVVHKNVLIDGQVVERIQVNTSTYRPRAAEVHVGTKKADEQVPENPEGTDPQNTTEGDDSGVTMPDGLGDPNIPVVVPIEENPQETPDPQTPSTHTPEPEITPPDSVEEATEEEA